MPNENLTEIAVILDRSGSMQTIARDMEGGFASFIAEQRRIPAPCLVSLYQFDDQFEVVYQEVPLAQVPPLWLMPRNRTALFDAIGRTIALLGERHARLSSPHLVPGKVVVVVITDGQENASREYTRESIRHLVEMKTRTHDWQFAFLGANIDSFAAAGGIGMSAHSTSNFQANRRGVGEMYVASSRGIGAYRVAPKGAALRIGPTRDKV